MYKILLYIVDIKKLELVLNISRLKSFHILVDLKVELE